MHAGIGLAAFADGGEEFAVLQLDTVHGHVHLGHVNLLFLAVDQIVVASDVGAGIADVAEEGAQRAIVVEGQAQCANRTVGGLELDAHVHGNAKFWVDGALDGIGLHDGAASLVGKQVHGVGSMVPQQVVGPATCLTQRVHVGAAEEVGLHIHLLDVEFAGLDLLVHPLVAGVEAAGVTHHGHLAGFLLHLQHFFGFCPAVGQRNFHLHVLASLHALDGL